MPRSLPADLPGEAGWRPRAGDPSTSPKVEGNPVPPVRKVGFTEPQGQPVPNQLPEVEETLPPPRRGDGKEQEQNSTTLDRAILLGAARTAVKQGDYDQAVARFDEYFRRFNDDPAIRREYAGVLVSANRLPQATQQLERLLAAQPGNLELRVTLGDILLSSKSYRKAIAQYQEVLKHTPKNLDSATKLARTYVFCNELQQALQVYDHYLARLQPEDENVPKAFPALLLDLEMAGDALRFLQVLCGNHPEDGDLQTDLVRCHAALGDQQKAVETLETLAACSPRAFAVFQSMGDACYESGDYVLAVLAYSKILQIDPANAFAQVGMARVHLQLFQPEKAREILTGLKAPAQAQRVVALTWAEYHQVVGEYAEAKQIYANFLCKDPADHEVRIALALLFDYVREFEKAKAEFAKVPTDALLAFRARLGSAATLIAQRFFHDAAEACRALLAVRPDDAAATALLTRALAKAGHVDEALAVSRNFLRDHPRHVAGALSIHFALGKVLLDAGRYLDAIPEYEAILACHSGRVPAAYYGLARALAKTGHSDRAHLLLASITGPGMERLRAQLLLGDEFAADFDDHQALVWYQDALADAPHNLAVLIRLADTQQRLATFSGCIDEAVHTATAILDMSPVNVRGHLALARSLSVGQQYRAVVMQYDRLLALDPHFSIAQREKARVLYSDHEFAAADAAYRQMLTPGADEQLHAALESLAQRDTSVREQLQLVCRAGLMGKALQAELGNLAHTCADHEARAELERMLIDYEARLAEDNVVCLEAEAKSKKDVRNYEAIPVYKRLLAAEPGNEEAAFELGQVYGALKQNQNELCTYSQLLGFDPLHRDAAVALERSSLDLQPQLRLGADLRYERGREFLANIAIARFPVSVLVPVQEENQFFQVGYAPIVYKPGDDRALVGNIIFGRGQLRCCDERLLLFGQLNWEEYPDRLHDRPTFEAGAIYDASDCVRERVRGFLENYEENGECLRQDIHRGGIEVGLDVQPTRRWQFGGTGRLLYYSDENTEGELYLYNNYFLCFAPNELKVVADMDVMGFAHQTVHLSSDHTDQHGALFPYFSPRAFAYYETRLEWTHWLSRDYFVHSNQCYFSLQYAFGFDSNMAVYNSFRALVNFDVKPWLSIGVDADQILSSVYNAGQVAAYVNIRFPCCCCHW
jgi:tetratricopeptide (TPR) repeat protein